MVLWEWCQINLNALCDVIAALNQCTEQP